MSNWNYLNQHRVNAGPFTSTAEDGFNGAFCLTLNGMKVKVIASDGMGWQHVSVSFHDYSKQIPSWSLLCKIKELFWEPEDWVVQFHPAKSQYVNNHPGCMHLWRCTSAPQPTPPSILTGIRPLTAAHG